MYPTWAGPATPFQLKYPTATVSYTGNTNTGATARSLISFNYETRQDKNFSYVAGGKISQLYHLKTIFVKQLDAYNTFRTAHLYVLDYASDADAHLTSVTERGKAVNDVTDLLTPTKFEYNASTATVEDQQINGIGDVSTYDYAVGDYNGDGKSDLVRFPVVYAP